VNNDAAFVEAFCSSVSAASPWSPAAGVLPEYNKLLAIESLPAVEVPSMTEELTMVQDSHVVERLPPIKEVAMDAAALPPTQMLPQLGA
jgi:hypothetical protein